jgi:uncharacterized protein (DUF2062 family)
MRKFLRARLPNQHSIQQNRWLRPITHWLSHPNLWHLHRRSVAGGVAVGLFCGLIPGPLQMLSAVFLVVWLRVNLPVALFTTLYTNPFTIVPLYLFAYEIGAWVSGAQPITQLPPLPELHWLDWFNPLWQWLAALGKPLLIGVPILAISLALLGYATVRIGWRMAVLIRWKQRKSH